jgi:hypothetical protein
MFRHLPGCRTPGGHAAEVAAGTAGDVRHMRWRRVATWLVLIGLGGVGPLPAQAAVMYRCGQDGRSYSQQPCPEGQRLELGDTRSAEQTEAAHELIRRQQRQGRLLEQERLQQENAAARRVNFVSFNARPPPAQENGPSSAPTGKKKPRRGGASRAVR